MKQANTIKLTLNNRVLAFCASRPETTVVEVIAEVGYLVSASSAKRDHERSIRRVRKKGWSGEERGKSDRNPIEVGKRHLLTGILVKLCRLGKIRRIRKGVYGPILSSLDRQKAM